MLKWVNINRKAKLVALTTIGTVATTAVVIPVAITQTANPSPSNATPTENRVLASEVSKQLTVFENDFSTKINQTSFSTSKFLQIGLSGTEVTSAASLQANLGVSVENILPEFPANVSIQFWKDRYSAMVNYKIFMDGNPLDVPGIPAEGKATITVFDGDTAVLAAYKASLEATTKSDLTEEAFRDAELAVEDGALNASRTIADALKLSLSFGTADPGVDNLQVKAKKTKNSTDLVITLQIQEKTITANIAIASFAPAPITAEQQKEFDDLVASLQAIHETAKSKSTFAGDSVTLNEAIETKNNPTHNPLTGALGFLRLRVAKGFQIPANWTVKVTKKANVADAVSFDIMGYGLSKTVTVMIDTWAK